MRPILSGLREWWNGLATTPKIALIGGFTAVFSGVVTATYLLTYLLHPPIGAVPTTKSEKPSPTAKQETSYFIVPVHFGTNRADESFGSERPTFGGRYSKTVAYGTADIAIPRHHAVGAMERPEWWRLELRETPERHIVVLKTALASKKQFMQGLSREQDLSPKKRMLVFIHGFNVGFEEAARRTGQIKFDLEFPGPAVFYSWPSQNELSVRAYLADREQVSASRALIEEFIADLASQSWADEIYLIAHSMGTQGLTEAIAALADKRSRSARKIREIILAAPDIDANLFRNVIAPSLLKAGASVTLYVSRDDVALRESKRLRGDFPRIGDASASVYVRSGIETIDATGLDTTLLGHSYYARHVFLADVASLIKDGKRAADRYYLRRAQDSSYWVFKPLAP